MLYGTVLDEGGGGGGGGGGVWIDAFYFRNIRIFKVIIFIRFFFNVSLEGHLYPNIQKKKSERKTPQTHK